MPYFLNPQIQHRAKITVHCVICAAAKATAFSEVCYLQHCIHHRRPLFLITVGHSIPVPYFIMHVPYNSAPYFLCSLQIQLHFSNLFYSLLQYILTGKKLKYSCSQFHSSCLVSSFPLNSAVSRKGANTAKQITSVI